MKKIAIIGHVLHGRSCLSSAMQSVIRNNPEVIVINNAEIKDDLRHGYLENVNLSIQEITFSEPIFLEREPSKFMSKPKNNFKK